MTEEVYIQTELIDGLEALKTVQKPLIQLTIACQTIEAMGAFLDPKPFACPGQSRKRFDLSIETLFPELYKKMNPKSVFYHSFRCSIIHYFQLHRNYRITNESDKHLTWADRTVQIHIPTLLEDTIQAGMFLIKLYDKNQIKRKKTGSFGLQFG